MQIPEPTDLVLLVLPMPRMVEGMRDVPGTTVGISVGLVWTDRQTDAWIDRSAMATFQERKGNRLSELDPVRAPGGSHRELYPFLPSPHQLKLMSPNTKSRAQGLGLGSRSRSGRKAGFTSSCLLTPAVCYGNLTPASLSLPVPLMAALLTPLTSILPNRFLMTQLFPPFLVHLAVVPSPHPPPQLPL